MRRRASGKTFLYKRADIRADSFRAQKELSNDMYYIGSSWLREGDRVEGRRGFESKVVQGAKTSRENQGKVRSDDNVRA